MRKFTVFTVILTIIIVVVGAEIFANDYLPRLRGQDEGGEMSLTLPDELDLGGATQTNVLGADIDYSNIPMGDDLGFTEPEDLLRFEDEIDLEEIVIPLDGSVGLNEPLEVPIATNTLPVESASTSDISDFEDENFISYSVNVYLREDQIKSAGFAGAYLENEAHDGNMYKTIYVTDLYDVEMNKIAIRTSDTLFAKVYVFQVGGLSSVSEVYEVLKIRAAEGLDVEINETNEFGGASFYMNDSRRPDVSFLTVRIGAMMYGFSYPKEYHSQIKNLITLLDLEF
jgi:hypothetical protein